MSENQGKAREKVSRSREDDNEEVKREQETFDKGPTGPPSSTFLPPIVAKKRNPTLENMDFELVEKK